MDNKDNSGHEKLPNKNESSPSSRESCESFEYQADIEESDADAENLARHKMNWFKRLGIRITMSRRNIIRDNTNMLSQRRISTDTENEILRWKLSLSLPNISAANNKSEESNINTLSQSAPGGSSWLQSTNVANPFLQGIKHSSLAKYFKKNPIHEKNTDDEPKDFSTLSQSAPGCSHWSQSSNVANHFLQGIESTVSKLDSSCTRYVNNVLAKKSPIHERNTDDELKEYSMKNKKMKTECEVASSNKTEENKISPVEETDTDSESS